jgi:hypothetical protein
MSKNSPLRGRLFAKLCDDMEAEHYCETSWLSHDKMLLTVFELKGRIIFLTQAGGPPLVGCRDCLFNILLRKNKL